MNNASFEHFPAENHPIFSALEPGKILKIWRISLKTGLTKKQKVTELYFNENDAITEVYTHNTELKNDYWPMLPDSQSFANRLKMTNKAVYVSRSIRIESVFD